MDEIHGLPFLSPLWAWSSKKLAYIHEVAQEIWDEMLPFPINILGKLYERAYFLFYKNIPFLTGSNSTKADLIHYGIAAKNISVIPHGLFIKPVRSVPLKEKSLTLLYVSRLVKMKGIEDAIRIFAEVVKKTPLAKLWIVGSGEESYVQKLHSLVVQLGLNSSVIFFGYVDEVKKIELYQKAHFLLHTSVREGFGLVVIEANSQGTPAITYDSPGLRDVVQNGVNGYTFTSGSYHAPADKITSLFDSPQYSLLAQSSIQSVTKYNWDTITKFSYKKLIMYIDNIHNMV
jgi:glycosyltransferase involved in cell wall biosynthesis